MRYKHLLPIILLCICVLTSISSLAYPFIDENTVFYYRFEGNGNDISGNDVPNQLSNELLYTLTPRIDFFRKEYRGTYLANLSHSGDSAPHTVSVMRPNSTGQWNNHTYWIYVGEQSAGKFDLWWAEDLDDASNWTEYPDNPIMSNETGNIRWPTVWYDEGNKTIYMMYRSEDTSFVIGLANSTNGINFTIEQANMVGGYASNPFLWEDPNTDEICLLYQYDRDGMERVMLKCEQNIRALQGIDTGNVTIADTFLGVWSKAPAMFYREPYYWLMTEGSPSNWNTYMYYSTSRNGPFTPSYESAVYMNATACPFPYIEDNQLYNFVCQQSGVLWSVGLYTHDLSETLITKTTSKLGLGNSAHIDASYKSIRLNSSLVNITGNFTIGFWFYPMDTDSPMTLIDKWDNATEPHGISLRTSANGAYEAFIGNSTLNGYKSTASNNVLVRKQSWQHVVLRYNYTRFALFLDGEQIASSTKNDPVGWNNIPLQVGIGSYPTIDTSIFGNFLIDELVLYNRSLSNQEIEELMVLTGVIGPTGANSVFLPSLDGISLTFSSTALVAIAVILVVVITLVVGVVLGGGSPGVVEVQNGISAAWLLAIVGIVVVFLAVFIGLIIAGVSGTLGG